MNHAIEITAAPARDTFRFFWIRENAPGRLEYDSGLPIGRSDLILAMLGVHPGQQRRPEHGAPTREQVISVLTGEARPDCLPAWAAKQIALFDGAADREPAAVLRGLLDAATRIEQCAAHVPGEVEVHLPYVVRKDWASCPAILQSCDFTLAAGGVFPRSVVETAAAHTAYMARLLGAASAHPEAGSELRHRIARRIPGALAQVLLPAGAEIRSFPEAAEVEVEVRLAAPACHAWKLAPPESDVAYFAPHAGVSMALQSAIRRWSMFCWLSELQRLENVPVAHAMLAYRSGSIYPGKRRTEYAFDTMNDTWFRPFFRHARKPLARLLAPIRAELLKAGNKALADQFYPAHKAYILERVRRQRRLLHNLVTGEGAIVDDILRFGADVRSADPRAAAWAGAHCAKRLAGRLRNLLPDHDFTQIAPVLLLEATNALHVALGGQPSLQSSVRMAGAG